ncbi:hypothetical protein [Lactobacillus intestinalis]|uniref:Uncharacterized protein n=1 Tax=Lactobacillus intestinalis DSM 6629 TaxID=1423761 RepID=A0ABR5PRL8_9LACO|nr:hypothetical protein [Lactobacillus intestinalis]KRM33884.1 hypothetical protein FC44_GL000806 [Lactobacillus intestinalis DSM 6629]UTW40473.1 hypothetical protein KBW87_00815 [Lactobacillus intestinalis]
MQLWQILIELVFVPILVNLISHILEKLIDEKLADHHQEHKKDKSHKRHTR